LVHDFGRAIRLAPGNALYFHLRGVAYAWKRERERAIADARKAVELEPTRAEFHAGLGNAYICERGLRDDHERAIECLTQAIALDAHNADYHARRGRSFWLMGKFDQALADYDRAIHLDSANASVYYARGILKRECGEPQAALRDLQVAAEKGYAQAKRELHPIVRFLNGFLSHR